MFSQLAVTFSLIYKYHLNLAYDIVRYAESQLLDQEDTGATTTVIEAGTTHLVRVPMCEGTCSSTHSLISAIFKSLEVRLLKERFIPTRY